MYIYLLIDYLSIIIPRLGGGGGGGILVSLRPSVRPSVPPTVSAL